MSESPIPSVNSWLEDELYSQYQHDRREVDPSWKSVFDALEPPPTHAESGSADTNGAPAAHASGNGGTVKVEVSSQPRAIAAPATPAAHPNAHAAGTQHTSSAPHASSAPHVASTPVFALGEGDKLQPLRGPALRIAENMTASLTMPVATSQRSMPVKVMEENRRAINEHRGLRGEGKISFTHLIAWGVVRAVETVPAINEAYTDEGSEAFRVHRGHVNLGIAVDVAGKEGARSLKVPSIKKSEAMSFAQFAGAFDDIVSRARTNKLTVADFEGTTVSITNPGTVGTAGSIPRLMPGQGAIIATGAIDYPAEYRGVTEDIRASMGLSKVMTVTCTYDHRVIQGAESGTFLARLQALLEGEDGFYERIYKDLGISAKPARWAVDQTSAPVLNADPLKQAAVARLIQAWRQRGHLVAHIDPLGLPRPQHPDLDLDGQSAGQGLTIWDLDRTFQCGMFGVLPLRELIEQLRATYAGHIGIEYAHVENPAERAWFEQRVEPSRFQWPLEGSARKRALRSVVEAEGFEGFLENRFKGHKRFSIEGGETFIAAMEELLERAAATGVEECVIGMAHRGRLTLLANVMNKGIAQMFSEFEGEIEEEFDGSGDVKYHMGESVRRKMSSGKEITVFVAPNPSHLEAVNPVVEGIVRPKQDRMGDTARERVIPVLVHGDAAMAGQGVVAETLNLSQLEGYNTGGTIHVVINNQIGFTTNPQASRSTTYCTDVALMVHAPVMHVNGDDPDACLRAVQLAFDFRQRFHRDVAIDILCWRKHGHNEGDDASYTQPVLYRKLRDHKPVSAGYTARLVAQGVVTPEEVEGWSAAQKKRLYEIYDQAHQNKEEWELKELAPMAPGLIPQDLPTTGVTRDMLERAARGITAFPADFHLHPKLARTIDKRAAALQDNSIDWALAETLAFGSLVLEGTPVRLSGQDSGRGTFSQRHAEFHDYETDRVYSPLQHLSPTQARFEVYNSPLSEYALMGFEFGYSVADQLSLVLWEAQYGDFVNGAQIIMDQFLFTAESKWAQPSGLVLLLPHGQEGGGPEHSSARLERFLQVCGESNVQVVCPSTPAQYFHLLRRQMRGGPDRRGLRKPLIVMTAKSLLRHPKVISTADELTNGVFHPVLADPTIADPSSVRKILLCTGKVYYELLAARDARKDADPVAASTAIVRVEQFYPFPEVEIREVLERYTAAGGIVWAQEEPRNMGAWIFMRTRLQRILANQAHVLGYAGRPESASTAPGSTKLHAQEQAELIAQAFEPPTIARRWKKRLIRKRKKDSPAS